MNVRGENFIMKVGIDLGGSHIAIGVVDENGRIIEKQERRILDKEKQEIKTFIEEYIIKNIKEMSKKYKITKNTMCALRLLSQQCLRSVLR